MAASFDDGSPEISGGIVGPVERVLVIGAGIAGLTVANALAHADVDCVVLEARDRIGGRLHTADLGGGRVDLGGSWIHHPEGNPLRRFARQVGIACRTGNPLPSLSAFDCATGRWLSPVDFEESLIGVEERYHEFSPGCRPGLDRPPRPPRGSRRIWPRPDSPETLSAEPGKHYTQVSKRMPPARLRTSR